MSMSGQSASRDKAYGMTMYPRFQVNEPVAKLGQVFQVLRHG